jgi:hypothetical protein
MKKQRFQFSRSLSGRKKREQDWRWVLEPFDMALLATVVLILFWLQRFL